MRKGQPKRRDLRKRIAELERKVLWLNSKLRTRQITASRYPERYAAIQRYYVDPFAGPELDKLGMEQYGQREAIRKCAVSLTKTIVYNASEITEQKWPDGWRAVQMTVTLVPPFGENAPEIREAIEEIKREDNK